MIHGPDIGRNAPAFVRGGKEKRNIIHVNQHPIWGYEEVTDVTIVFSHESIHKGFQEIGQRDETQCGFDTLNRLSKERALGRYDEVQKVRSSDTTGISKYLVPE